MKCNISNKSSLSLSLTVDKSISKAARIISVPFRNVFFFGGRSEVRTGACLLQKTGCHWFGKRQSKRMGEWRANGVVGAIFFFFFFNWMWILKNLIFGLHILYIINGHVKFCLNQILFNVRVKVQNSCVLGLEPVRAQIDKYRILILIHKSNLPMR